MKEKTHLPALDGVRALAILAVILGHATIYSGFFPRGPAERGLFFAFSRLGVWGVDLFFVLSGFLITGLLLDAKGSPHYFRDFYLRRLLRIFPLYYLYLFLVFAVAAPFYPPLQLSAGNQLWFWGYLANFKMFFSPGWPVIPGLDHLWSLAIEEQFYLCWPLFVAFFSRKSIKPFLLGIFLAGFLSRIWLGHLGYDARHIRIFTFAKMDMLAAGAFLMVLYREGTLGREGKKHRLLLALPPLLAVLCFFALLAGPAPAAVLAAFKSTCLGLFFVYFLGLAVLARPGSLLYKILSCRPLALTARYSYSMYLFQSGLIFFLAKNMLPRLKDVVPAPPAAWGILFVVSALASFAAGFLTYTCFERFFLKLKDVVAPQQAGLRQAATPGPGEQRKER